MSSFKLPKSNLIITPFYDSNQAFFNLTNFARTPIKIQGKVYPTAEHYFQAEKFSRSPDLQNKFLMEVQRLGDGPMQALSTARQWTNSWTKADWQAWDQRKEAVMEIALRQKLKQHPHIAQELLSTGNSCLIEDTAPRDEKTWGWGADGSGQNRLGILWMKLRNELWKAQNRSDLVVAPEKLYATVQTHRKTLGKRQQIVQQWPDIIPQNAFTSPPPHSTSPIDIFTIANDLKIHFNNGCRFQATSSKGEKIIYGISRKFGSFYIRGKNRNGSPIEVYVKGKKLFENNRPIIQSNWANWALPIIQADLKKKNLPLQSQTPIPQPIQSRSSLFNSLRYLIAVSLIGPIVGISNYLWNLKALLFAASITATVAFLSPLTWWGTLLAIGLCSHAVIAVSETFFKRGNVAIPAAPVTTSENEHFGPIPKAILSGFKAANDFAGKNNEPYGKKAFAFCNKIQGTAPKLKNR